ncbi:MAG: GNAT family N-acetyltransferase [Elusimicrobiota bacterium]|nr:GNAT family N-acetyltransferase [Elusimicrobiota bacterium]
MSGGVTADAWLTGLFGRPVSKVDPGADLSSLPAGGFAYAKVPVSAVAEVSRLEAAGFRVVDVNMTFSRGRGGSPPPAAPVARVDASTAAAVLDIAGSCFRFSRFHLDPLVDDALAHRIKREWIRSFVEGRRGHSLWAVLDQGKPAGFLAVLTTETGGKKQAVIDLIGVAAASQGRGFGRDLVRFFTREFSSYDELLVGTQAANAPSMRLYESCGFRAARAAFVLHRHS